MAVYRFTLARVAILLIGGVNALVRSNLSVENVLNLNKYFIFL